MNSSGAMSSPQPPNTSLGPNEFRLKLEFKPSNGQASRIFAFYKEWLESTNQIVNEFAKHINRGLSIEIGLVEIKEGSADPKFVLVPKLTLGLGSVDIPEDIAQEIYFHASEIINTNTDHLLESVGDDNFDEFFLEEIRIAKELGAKLEEKVAKLQAIPSGEGNEAIMVVDSAKESKDSAKKPDTAAKKEEIQKYNRSRVFGALQKMASSASENLINGEKVTQLSHDGETIVITPELVNSSRALEVEKAETSKKKHKSAHVKASKVILIGKGTWTFLWNNKPKRMIIRDKDWLERFSKGEVTIRSGEEFTVDITEEETRYSKMGVQYKKKLTFYIDKIA